MNRSWLLVLLVGVFLLGAASSCESQSSEVAGEGSNEIRFLAMADWGQNSDAQRRVANAMRDFVRESKRQHAGVLCGGDNIYLKLTGVDDPQWGEVFERMYDPGTLNFPFYIAPGNHDYEDGKIAIELEYARRNPQSRWTFPGRYYRLDFPAGSAPPLVSVLMLDSNRDQMGRDAWRAELKWIQAELTRPRTATWLVAVAHHPLFSNGDHGDNGVLQNTWGPMFRRGGVDMYICGHDHDLQHLEIRGWPMSFLLVGGGGAQTRQMRVDKRGPFSKRSHGFAALSFSLDRLTVQMINERGEALHTFERARSGAVRVIESMRSDRAVPRTPQSINRPDLPEPVTQESR